MFKKSFLIILIFIFSFTIAWQVLSWTEPTQAPPQGNVSTPLNYTSTAQTKTATLTFPAFYDQNNTEYFLDPSASQSGKLGGNLETATLLLTPGSAPAAAAGKLYYNSTDNKLYYYNGASWVDATPLAGYWTASGNDIYNNNSGNVAVGTTSPGTDKLKVQGTANITGNAVLGEDLTIGSGAATGFVSNLRAWGLNARTQGMLIFPEGTVTDDGAGNLNFGSTAIIMNPASGSYIRVQAGSYSLGAWGYLYVDIPPTGARASTIAPSVGAWSDTDRAYDHRDRVVLCQRKSDGQIFCNFSLAAEYTQAGAIPTDYFYYRYCLCNGQTAGGNDTCEPPPCDTGHTSIGVSCQGLVKIKNVAVGTPWQSGGGDCDRWTVKLCERRCCYF